MLSFVSLIHSCYQRDLRTRLSLPLSLYSTCAGKTVFLFRIMLSRRKVSNFVNGRIFLIRSTTQTFHDANNPFLPWQSQKSIKQNVWLVFLISTSTYFLCRNNITSGSFFKCKQIRPLSDNLRNNQDFFSPVPLCISKSSSLVDFPCFLRLVFYIFTHVRPYIFLLGLLTPKWLTPFQVPATH